MNQNKNKSFKVVIDPKNKPDLLRNNEWQALLRKQYAHIQKLKVKNIGKECFYSDFLVSNPHTKSTYKVAIRSVSEPLNFCECLDFKTNKLGTCKHIEAVFLQLEMMPNVDLEIAKKVTRNYTSIYVDYLHHRHVKIRHTNGSSSTILTEFLTCFDDSNSLILEKASYLNSLIEKNADVSSMVVYSDAKELIQWHANYLNRIAILEAIDLRVEVQKHSELELRDYQIKQIQFMLINPKAILSNDIAMGLSHSTIASIILHKSLFKVNTTIIVSDATEFWKCKIEKYTPYAVKILSRHDFKFLTATSNHLSIVYVIKGDDLIADAKKLDGFSFDYIVFDNADLFSKLESESATALKSLTSKFKHILSNRNLYTDVNSFYSQLQAVDIFFPGSYFNFINRYALKNVHGAIVAIKNADELHDRTKNIYQHTCLIDDINCHRNIHVKPIPFHLNIYEETLKLELKPEHLSPVQLYHLSSSLFMFNHGFAESKLFHLVALLKLINLDEQQIRVLTSFDNYKDVIRTYLMQTDLAVNGELHKSISVMHVSEIDSEIESDYLVYLDYFSKNKSLHKKASITLISQGTFEEYLFETSMKISQLDSAYHQYIQQLKHPRKIASVASNTILQTDLFKPKLSDHQQAVLSQIYSIEKELDGLDDIENLLSSMDDCTDFQKQVIGFIINKKKK